MSRFYLPLTVGIALLALLSMALYNEHDRVKQKTARVEQELNEIIQISDKNYKLEGEKRELQAEITRLMSEMDKLASLQPVIGFIDQEDVQLIIQKLTPSTPFDSDFRITSRFGEGRGYQGELRMGHLGNDLVPKGDWYVHPMWEGEVVDIGIDRWLGKYVVVEHADNIRTRYCHLSKIYYTALPGKKVGLDTRLGVMGATGHADGAHLHLQLEVFNGEKWIPVDIYPWLKGHGGEEK